MTETASRVLDIYGGQGSQRKDMGMFLLDISTEARRVIEAASNALGISIVDLIRFDPEGKLYGDKKRGIKPDSEYIMKGLFTIQTATRAALTEHGVPNPDAVAGHSAGEYAALNHLNVAPFPRLLDFASLRGQKMQEIGSKLGTMVASVTGLDSVALQRIITSVSSNFPEIGLPIEETVRNSPTKAVLALPDSDQLWKQLVSAVESFGGQVRAYPESPASHYSPLEELKRALEPHIPHFENPLVNVPLISDIKHGILTTAVQIRRTVEEHVTTQLDWTNVIEQAKTILGINSYVIVGPGGVQAAILRDMVPLDRISRTDDLDSFKATVTRHKR